MSQATIAKWNSIPLERPESSTSKRYRPEDLSEQSDDDDDVSIVSRSPSPQPDVKTEEDIHDYDKYARGAPREVITVDTKIKPTNKGFAMLAKLGWVEGQPLGISGEGRVDPIPFMLKNDLTGLGKTNQDFRMIETTVSSRRNLDSERQHKETEEQRRIRENAAARKSALADEISSTLRPFYCTLCDKQFQNVAQYDEHTNSYAHHHKARAKDMQANIRLKPKEEIEKRKEKERKREEKELRKLAAAQGIKISKPSVTRPPPTNASNSTPAPKDQPENRSGWISNSTPSSSTSSGRSGWSSIPTAMEQVAMPPIAPVPPHPPHKEPSEDMDVDGTPIQEPTFTASTWAPSCTIPSVSSSNTLPVNPANNPPTGCFDPPSSMAPLPPSTTQAPLSVDTKSPAQPVPPPVAEPKSQESSRSNWQKFQKAGRRR